MESESEMNMAAPEGEEKEEVSKKIDEEEKEVVVEDFEFTFVFECLPASPVPADVVFFEWRMKQMFPVMNSDEIIRVTEIAMEEQTGTVQDVNNGGRRMPLGELMKVEKELAFPSDADEIETTVAVGAYCVWNPPTKTTRRWCIRLWDFLRRGGSSVDGKSAAESSDGVGRRRRRR